MQAVLPGENGPFMAGISSSPGQNRKRRRPSKPVDPHVSAQPEPAAGAAETPAEEHVLIQQWGFEVIVRIVPLGWQDSETTAPEKRRTSLETANMYSNPLYTSEDTSASSDSNDAGEQYKRGCTMTCIVTETLVQGQSLTVVMPCPASYCGGYWPSH